MEDKLFIVFHIKIMVTFAVVEPNRASEWDSVVTIHDSSSNHLATVPAHTWHLHHHRIGRHQLSSKFTTSRAQPNVSITLKITMMASQ